MSAGVTPVCVVCQESSIDIYSTDTNSSAFAQLGYTPTRAPGGAPPVAMNPESPGQATSFDPAGNTKAESPGVRALQKNKGSTSAAGLRWQFFSAGGDLHIRFLI